MPKLTDWPAIVKAKGYKAEVEMFEDLCFRRRLTPDGIAAEVGLSAPTVRIKMRELGYLPLQRSGTYIPWDRLAQFHGFLDEQSMLIALYATRGLGDRTIGAMIGVSPPVVRKRVLLMGLKRHPRGGNNRVRHYPGSARSNVRGMPVSTLREIKPRHLAERLGIRAPSISGYLSETRREGLL